MEREPGGGKIIMDQLGWKAKIEKTKTLIHCWAEAFGKNNICVSYSGGKDSEVLLHIARKIYPDIKAVFSNTGLEYPHIIKHVHSHKNIIIVRPKIPFHIVIQKYGWPVISKKVARFVSDCQNASESNMNTVRLRLTGITSRGYNCKSGMLSKKWRFLIKAPFKISDSCCHYIKKQPLEKYYKKNNLRPMIGVMRSDSNRRDKILANGCNLYDLKNPISYPLADWNTEDIWSYIKYKNINYCSIYDKGEKRTGCVFCMFGINYDQERFIRLKHNSPKQYNYVINKLGANKVLDFLKIPY